MFSCKLYEIFKDYLKTSKLKFKFKKIGWKLFYTTFRSVGWVEMEKVGSSCVLIVNP